MDFFVQHGGNLYPHYVFSVFQDADRTEYIINNMTVYSVSYKFGDKLELVLTEVCEIVDFDLNSLTRGFIPSLDINGQLDEEFIPIDGWCVDKWEQVLVKL